MNQQSLLQYLGILGNILLVVSYLPQIKKILVTQKTEDISIFMWLIIALGDLLLLLYAVGRNDIVFVILFTIFEMENLVMIYLALKFKKKDDKIKTLSARENMGKNEEESANTLEEEKEE